MIKPKKLQPGDTIGIVPSSSSARQWELDAGVAKLQKFGYKVLVSEHTREIYTHGYLAASDAERAADINEMLANPDVDAIMCQRGGYGAHRIVDKINWKLLKDNPRLFIGYSDVTLLHLAIAKECDMVSVLGPMPASEFGKGLDDFTAGLFGRIVMSPQPAGLLPNPPGERVESLVDGSAEGELVGGNLSLLAAACGTKYDVDARGKIIFIEDVGEEPYRIDRMLSQLRLAGKFDDCSGIILGDFNNCEVLGKPTLNLHQVMDEIVVPAGKPALFNFQCGHCMPMVTLPLGVRVRIDTRECSVTVLEAAVN